MCLEQVVGIASRSVTVLGAGLSYIRAHITENESPLGPMNVSVSEF